MATSTALRLESINRDAVSAALVAADYYGFGEDGSSIQIREITKLIEDTEGEKIQIDTFGRQSGKYPLHEDGQIWLRNSLAVALKAGYDLARSQVRDNSLILMIERLKAIKAHDRQIAPILSIRKKSDEAFLPFAESEISFIDKDNLDEAGAHILELHGDALKLRSQCDVVLRSNEDSVFPLLIQQIDDTFLECCARIENIVSVVHPDLMEAVDAVL
jgi:hypothetical protein